MEENEKTEQKIDEETKIETGGECETSAETSAQCAVTEAPAEAQTEIPAEAQTEAPAEAQTEIPAEAQTEVSDEAQTEKEADIEDLKAAARDAEKAQERAQLEYILAVEEAKRAKKAIKKKKRETRNGVPVGIVIMISAITMVLTLAIAFTTMFFWRLPIAKDSLVGRIIAHYAHTSAANVGGNIIEPGANVTINVNGNTASAAAVYAKAGQSVVGIRVAQRTNMNPWESASYQVVAEGSGVIFTSDGYIITNHHIAEEFIDPKTNKLASEFQLRIYTDMTLQEYYIGTIVGFDAKTDLALLKIEATGLTPIEIADSGSVTVGEEVFAIGSPAGLNYMNSISNGIVSGLNRSMSNNGETYYDLIQTNAPLSYGNSGGALLNSKGELIGINFMKIVASGYEGMSFAISSNTITDIIGQIMNNGSVQRPWLGITVNTTYTAQIAAENGLPAGAWITEVTPGSCTANAGIGADTIITVFNGTPISTFTQLKTELAKYKPGDTVTLTCYIVSEKVTKDFNVTLGAAN